MKASQTHGIWQDRIPTAASTGVACALESEDRYDSFIEELHKILMR
jgi:hypothetical protein